MCLVFPTILDKNKNLYKMLNFLLNKEKLVTNLQGEQQICYKSEILQIKTQL